MRSYAVFLYSVVNNRLEENYNRLPNEDLEDYFVRLYSNRNQYGLSCEQAADLMNKETGFAYGESTYRKRFKAFSDGIRYCENHMSESYIVEQTRELEKQRIRLQDERAALKRLLREDARKDSLLDVVRESFSEYTNIKPFENHYHVNSDGTLAVMLSDLHIGIEFDNQIGKYNVEIARERLQQYAQQVSEFCKTKNPKKCVVLLAGDMISGEIHTTLRIENKENLVNQIKIASELVSNFIGSISGLFTSVDVYSVAGNHSRAFANKDECMLGDMLDDLIPFYIQTRLMNICNVNVHSESNKSYVTFFVENNLCVLTHGDFDQTNAAGIGKLQRLVDGVVDCLFCAHNHEFLTRDIDGCHVIQCGCLCGSGDQYCQKNRLSGSPSQVMTYFDEGGKLKDVMPVYF